MPVRNHHLVDGHTAIQGMLIKRLGGFGRGHLIGLPKHHSHRAAHGGHGGGHGHPLAAAHAHEPPATMLIPLWVLALASLALGVYFTVTVFYALANGIYGTLPFLVLFQVGFLYTGLLSLIQQYGPESVEVAQGKEA